LFFFHKREKKEKKIVSDLHLLRARTVPELTLHPLASIAGDFGVHAGPESVRRMILVASCETEIAQVYTWDSGPGLISGRVSSSSP
jgi:hypothetical protein